MIAKIAVSAANFAIDKPYSYFVPEEMALTPGIRVQIPFGRGNRQCEGVVLSLEDGGAEGLKTIRRKLDDTPVVSDYMLRMAAFLHERYFCTFYDAIRTMLPAGIWFQTKDTYSLTENTEWKEKSIRSENARAILTFLTDCGGETDGAALRRVVPDPEAFEKAITYLLRQKWISTQQDYLRRTADKTEKIAVLAVPVEEAMAFALSRPKSALMQKAVLELLCAVSAAAVKEICYFTGASASTVKRLEKLGYLEMSDRPVLRCSEIRPVTLDGPLALNDSQQKAYDGLYRQMQSEKPGAALLYGVTGSGKTSVYIRLIRQTLEEKKTAMLLVPEIALTPQLLGLMAAHFGSCVAVLHSSLSAGERYDQWKRIRDGEATVVIGTRSAVFAPCQNLGLVILDEEQEHSYKSENAPRYDAREVALWRGIREKALVLFGSATPSVETMYHAKTGVYSLYTLPQRYNGKPLPDVQIVDMREELRQGNDLSISYPLQDAIRQTMDGDRQTILFLNRRGNSRALVCVDCRKIPECPRCNARLTYHSANERMMCHYCGYSQPAPVRCPECGGAVKRIGVGTQKVQQELETLFPGKEIQRMDTDTVSAANTHEDILRRFRTERVPVLVGTQMVAKGLNLPDVTLVGVLDADLSLYTDSYRAAETTFNMLTQVVGRAGRGEDPGSAVIQTMVPEHRVITMASQQDYDGFYDLEIRLRQMQSCPPFGDLATVTFSGQEEARVLRGAVKFRDSLDLLLKQAPYTAEDCTVLGPAPCPVPKINYNYRYRLTLRCRMTRSLRALVAHLLRQFSMDGGNRGVSVFADVNGYD